jgi:hypothetical protein
LHEYIELFTSVLVNLTSNRPCDSKDKSVDHLLLTVYPLGDGSSRLAPVVDESIEKLKSISGQDVRVHSLRHLGVVKAEYYASIDNHV